MKVDPAAAIATPGAHRETVTLRIIYNGVTRELTANSDEQVSLLLQQAIRLFNISQQPHLLSLFRSDGSKVQEHESLEQARLRNQEDLLLRQDTVKGG